MQDRHPDVAPHLTMAPKKPGQGKVQTHKKMVLHTYYVKIEGEKTPDGMPKQAMRKRFVPQ